MQLLLSFLSCFVQIFATILILLLNIAVFIFNNVVYLSKTPKNIAGEIAVVTGGANGLGKKICIQLAQKGFHVAVVDIDLAGAEDTAHWLRDKYNIKSKAYRVDVANHDEVMTLSENIAKDMGDVTILVNNAAMITFSQNPPHWSEVQKLINVNLTAHYWTLEAFLPKMKELKRGHIVALSSLAGHLPFEMLSQYTATKFAVRGLMSTLRQELLHSQFENIHTTTIFPYCLDSNAAIKEMYEKSKSARFHAIASSDDAAINIVKAMLLNEKELFFPSYLELWVRVHACLPVDLQDLLIYLTTKQFTKDLLK